MRIRPPLALTVWAAGLVSGVFLRTCRLRLEPGGHDLPELPSPAILACWHEQSLAATPLVLLLVTTGRRVAVMTSHSRDGEVAARVAAAYGVAVTRGSTSRGGRAGLLALYHEVRDFGASPIVLPDGPRGPRRRPKPGVVALAQMSGAPIVPLACAPRHHLTLRSWDRMLLPVPFTQIRVALGAPIQVPRQLSEEERDRHLARLEAALNALTESVATVSRQTTRSRRVAGDGPARP